MAMTDNHIVNSEHSWQAFIVNARELFEKHRYLTWTKPRIGPDRSLDQNALFHVWATEYAAHLLNCTKQEVTKAVLAGMKRTIKKRYYGEFGFDFMVHEIVNPFTGEKKKDFTSSKDWKRGEMYHVLTWLQMLAANDGLILEAKGEYAKLKRQEQETA